MIRAQKISIGILRSLYRRKHVGVGLGTGIVFLFLAACETPTTAPNGRTSAAVGPMPSSDVNRLQAWRDAETVARAREGGSPAVGQGQSMAPLYGDNTMLVITKVDYRDLAPGMTVAYIKDNGRQVVHRLVAKDKNGNWTAQGFNNDWIDSTLVTPWNLIGVIYASFVHDFPEDEPTP